MLKTVEIVQLRCYGLVLAVILDHKLVRLQWFIRNIDR